MNPQLEEDLKLLKEIMRELKQKIYRKVWRDNNREKIYQAQKKWRQENANRVKETNRRWARNNLRKRNEYQKKWAKAHRQRVTALQKKWRIKNIERSNAWHRKRQKERYHTDVVFRLGMNLRNRLNLAIKRGSKNGSAVRDLGCSVQEFKIYLESKFQPGMHWDNQGVWHIDHIKPLASFNLEQREELVKACHYTNLQPLWKIDNHAKGAKIPELSVI